MSNVASPVIVLEGVTGHDTKVYHRDFPEIRAEGNNAGHAASQLTNHLARALDSALTEYRREALNNAIADVEAFVSRNAG